MKPSNRIGDQVVSLRQMRQTLLQLVATATNWSLFRDSGNIPYIDETQHYTTFLLNQN
jgi:hypothetical protein